LHAYHDAAVAARTDDLDAPLDPGCVLVHMTAYGQPKDEWLALIRSGPFDYHRIDVDGKSPPAQTTDGTAVLAGRGVFDATIDGMRAPWRLQFTVRLAKRGDRWVITHMSATTF
jgi:Domain of unknown function (DUF4440)